ncbi:MAG: hypothetical protein QME64_00575 [bacterium]|nr:hypothetical protein [bacterium]
MPTGGVTLTTAVEFLRAGATALGIGTDLVDPKAVKEQKFEMITENARKYLEILRAV